MFKTLEGTNFQSYKHFSIPLENQGLVLISGRNGRGKTTLFSALCWVLYARTLKSLKADDVVNNRIKKNCNVSLLFKDGMNITRYRKDSVNNNKILVGGKRSDLNKDMERMIHKVFPVTFDSFVNSFMINITNTRKFGTLTQAKAKDFLEEIIPLTELDKALDHCKQELANKISNMNKAEWEMDAFSETLVKGESSVVLHKSIAKWEKEKDAFKAEIKKLENKLDNHKKEEAGLLAVYRTITDQRNIVSSIKSSCPTCFQKVLPKHKSMVVSNLVNKAKSVKTTMKSVRRLRKALEIDTGSLESALEGVTGQIFEAEKDLTEALRNETIITKIDSLKQSRLKIKRSIEFFNLCREVLGREGARLWFYRSVLEFLNEKLSEYLSFFDAHATWTIDIDQSGNITSTIEAFKGGNSYSELSSGESAIFDFCFAIALQDFIRRKEGLPLDFMMIDEVMSPLDDENIDKAIDLLKSLQDRSSIFVISHRKEVVSHFDNVWMCEKKEGFSNLFQNP